MIPCCLKTTETVIPQAARVGANCVVEADAAWGFCFFVGYETANFPLRRSEALEAQVAVVAAREMTVPKSTLHHGKMPRRSAETITNFVLLVTPWARKS